MDKADIGLISNEQYIKEGGQGCPRSGCRSGDIVQEEIDQSNELTVTGHCFCRRCGLKWKEHYRLIGYEED